MKKLFTGILLLTLVHAFAQTTSTSADSSWKKIYHAAADKINDLVHTKLDVKFDYTKSWMYGKAWLTLHPHFYSTDSLSLDAKGMTIEEVSVMSGGKNVPLKYSYDSMNLHIVFK